MTVTDHPAQRLAAVATVEDIGRPGVDGRWQPTRAGVVNSWAWAEENLLFADGWLALTGPNGSGKSLTASMLITVLLDADTSQTALSVSGKAAGTLTSRHTDWNDKEDRTGAWWIEYGMRYAATGHTRYLTTGLWLRASSGTLTRAFFIAPARVGGELTLQRDREPVRIEDLAAQLAAHDGELFTSSDKLRAKAVDRLRVVEDERGYRQAIRTRLFAPLDEVQFDALVGVLRSLRSLRTAEAISPKRMQEVLTDALPALDPERLTIVAETMERIAELEAQLERNREEAKLLEATDKLYGRYVRLVAQVEAAELTAANTDFDNQARRAREATELLEAARTAQTTANTQHTATRGKVAELEGQRAAADSELRGHAGAELPHMEQRATELAKAANEADRRAEQAEQDAASTTEQAQISAAEAAHAQEHLAGLTDELRMTSSTVGADSAMEHLLAAAREVRLASSGPTPVIDIDRICATPLAWTESRTEQVEQVRQALRGHERAASAEAEAADNRRGAEAEEDQRRDIAEAATARRQQDEDHLADELTAWSIDAHHLGPIPEGLATRGTDTSADDRLDLDRLSTWLEASADRARVRIDLAGRQHAAETAVAVAQAANQAAEQARGEHEAARLKATEAASNVELVQEEAAAEAEAAEHERVVAQAQYEESVDAARAVVAESEHRLADGVVAVADTARDWLARVHRWRTALTQMTVDATAVPTLRDISGFPVDAALAEIDALNPANLEIIVARAHDTAVRRLEREVTNAEGLVARETDAVDAITTQLNEARRAAPIPTAPPWRSRRPEDGVPLWALVDFADHVSGPDADRLEGALLVAGLLDAVVTPDGRAIAGDLTITGSEPATGLTLADVLRIEPEPGIDGARVAALLRAVPVDGAGSDLAAGRLTTGVLTAAAPEGYEAAFIGRTARERARLQRVADLDQDLQAAQERLRVAETDLAACRQAVLDADTERDTLPPAGAMLDARQRVSTLQRAVVTAQRASADSIAQAESALAQALHLLELAAAERQARLGAAEQRLRHAEEVAEDRRRTSEQAAEEAHQRTHAARQREAERDRATAAQDQADAERGRFPDLTPVRTAQSVEDTVAGELTRASAALLAAIERHTKAGQAVREALRALNQAARLPDGSLLPTQDEALGEHARTVHRLARQVEGWSHATRRVSELLDRAGKDVAAAADCARRLSAAKTEAERVRLAATRQAAAVATARELHGADYERLRRTSEQLGEALTAAHERLETLIEQRQLAAEDAAAAQSTLNGIAPQRDAADRRREDRLRRMRRLVDEKLATLPEGAATDTSGRPANLTAGLAWAKQLLAERPASADRLTTLVQARNRALVTLEGSARTVSLRLARFNKQVTLVSVEDTDWRRAVVAEPETTRGEDLHVAVDTLKATAAQLEQDLREDVKRTLKTSMFTQLRRDVQVRREAARELVRRIRDTLGGVRTGVANVGVQVDWTVREDEDAKRMVELISLPPSDETFEQMYTVLRQRMDEKAGEPWTERVAHTFDYRAWHEWQISLTHSSFGDGRDEKFRAVTPRSNPLESLSTGERRLATMLPLLAAAWSMYSGESYHGPRLVSIDEIDAAFDEPNLRQVLALLRGWQFDVLATAPFMTPMIKKEAGCVVVHEVVKAGKYRVSVPWLWQGHGEPRPLTLELAPGPAGDDQ